MSTEIRALNELKIDQSLDPRNKRSQETINGYAESLDRMPPIDIDQNNRILDGIHRYLAHEQAGREEIEVKVFNIEDDVEALKHSISANAKHGVPFKESETKCQCIRLCKLGLKNVEIAGIVGRHETVVGKHVKETRNRLELEDAEKFGTLYSIRDDNNKRVYSEAALARELDISRTRLRNLLEKYFAPKVADLRSEGKSRAEIAKELDLTPSRIDNIFKNYPNIVEPPTAIENEVDDEPNDESEADGSIEWHVEEDEDDEQDEVDLDEDIDEADETTDRTHMEMQWMLLWLGSKMGLSLWVAPDDRRKSYDGNTFEELAGMLTSLPVDISAVDESRTIERIDVLWLKDERIVAAFEIEHTTTIYSGLLRISDMLVAINDSSIKPNIVASVERLHEARTKIKRPTFKNNGLADSCHFIPYTKLTDIYNEAKHNGSIPYDWEGLLNEIGYKL
ncbi:MAG: ParB N-terminal domain-containing protein [Chloroflexota bacterium]|nr:ParB N-terminal domain-containing protein [Chloroflexota bacterium]